VYVLVVDGPPAVAEPVPGLLFVDPAALELPSFRELAFKYEPVELCTAVKPGLLNYVLEREEAVVYLDPDLLVLQPFDALQHVLRSAHVVLTPHTLAPYPDDGLRPSENGMLVTGVYNLGFIALRRSDETSCLLTWWASRLEDGATVDLPKGSFTDQKWADLVPAYVKATAILRDPAYNVAYWNLHERPLRLHRATFVVGDRPVACFHFSGYDPGDPTTLTRRVRSDLARTRVEPGSALEQLLRLYTALHLRHGWESYRRCEYGFARFSDGAPIDGRLRRLYLGLDPGARTRFGDPFRADGPDSFIAWAVAGTADRTKEAPA
jgi:hypothetical protein